MRNLSAKGRGVVLSGRLDRHAADPLIATDFRSDAGIGSDGIRLKSRIQRFCEVE